METHCSNDETKRNETKLIFIPNEVQTQTAQYFIPRNFATRRNLLVDFKYISWDSVQLRNFESLLRSIWLYSSYLFLSGYNNFGKRNVFHLQLFLEEKKEINNHNQTLNLKYMQVQAPNFNK